jgi:hypothetical protein
MISCYRIPARYLCSLPFCLLPLLATLAFPPPLTLNLILPTFDLTRYPSLCYPSLTVATLRYPCILPYHLRLHRPGGAYLDLQEQQTTIHPYPSNPSPSPG